MLEATLPRNPITNLIPFVPRQVTLAQHQTMKTKNLPSENGFTNETLKSSKKDKTKKKKSSSSSSKVSSLFHQSIATYLEHNCFSKTLDVFRSEASIGEVDGSNVAAFDLFEIFSKHLESSKFDSKASINVNEEIGLGNDTLNKNNIAELDLVENKSAGPADSIKKKKKKSKGSDTGVVDDQPADINEFTKCEKGNEKSTNGVVSESPIKSHKKKNRSEPVTDSCNEDQADYTISEPLLDESNKKLKDKKKKKSKAVSADNDGQSSLQVLELKDAKKKKHKSKSESSVGNIGEDTSEIANTVSVEEEKKGSKKRKRSTPDENRSQLNDKSLTKEAKKSNAEGSEDDKGNDPSLQSIPILESEVNAGKKRKTENGHVDSQRSPSDQQHKSSSGCEDLENKGREGSASQKSLKKQQNGSAEPKTVNAFQRVKIEKVEFADDRLQDNSYWAKDGAEIGYGAKAQEVLGQVRGRDFRHEKTKKKRGSYRGGQIDLQSHSVKFNYSDDD